MQRSLRQAVRAGRVAVRAVLCGAVLCSAAGAMAGEREEAKSYQLRWVREGGAETCVSGAALERLLEQVLAGRVETGAAPMLLEGVAKTAAEPLSYTMQVTVRDARTGDVLGERELTTADPKCSVLTPALLLVLAMSIDPTSAKQGLPPAVTEELRRGREEDVDVWPAAETSGQPPIIAVPPPRVEPAP